MKKITFRVMCLGFAAMMALVSCDKKDTQDPKSNNNNNGGGGNGGNGGGNGGGSDVTIVDPASATGSKGSATFTYNGEQVTYTSVRTKDGKIWLQQNLGAKQVAASMYDLEAYGDLYQWGRWADGHQLRTPTPKVISGGTLSPNNPSGLPAGGSKDYVTEWWRDGAATDTWNATTAAGASATNGCDPCKVLGEKWRLPTPEDWSSVLAAEGITNNQTAFESNLKIPVAGWRATSTAGIASAGESSWFWSSKASNKGGIGVWILKSSIQKEYSDSRAYGTSVRCVKD